jgi:hypothetical protein
MSIPPKLEGELCPKCGSPIQSGTAWCSFCGQGTSRLGKSFHDGGKYPFSWIWFVSLFVLIPIATCGGCIVFGNSSAVSTGKGDVGPMFMVVAFAIQCLSLIVGLGLLVYNGVKGRR